MHAHIITLLSRMTLIKRMCPRAACGKKCWGAIKERLL